jgi:RNA-splicing ligase RtcB
MWRSYLKRGYHINPLGPPEYSYRWYEAMCDRIGMNFERAQASIGTLGGGNHFIEMGEVVDGDACWLIVHTGSRQLGEKVCRYWQGVATAHQKSKRGVEYERQIQKIRETARNQDIPGLIDEYRKRAGVHAGPRELDYLEGQDFFGYLWDMLFAQSYAKLNRRIILSECLDVLDLPPLLWAVEGLGLETVHNYIDFEDMVVRKGAVRAHKDEPFILPFNMRDGTIICQGVGNPEWNASAPHGAGRLFSRSHAKRTLDAAEAREQMEGIYTSVIPLDEAPGAYKPAEVIEAAIGETARVIERVKPVLNLKAG